MHTSDIVLGLGGVVAVAAVAILSVPTVLGGRVLPGFMLGDTSISGIADTELPGVISRYEDQLVQQEVRLVLRDQEATLSLQALGVSVDTAATTQAILNRPWLTQGRLRQTVAPTLLIDSDRLADAIKQTFADKIKPPQNATLTITPLDTLTIMPSQSGEGVDLITLTEDIRSRTIHNRWQEPIELTIITTSPTIHEGETQQAKQYGEQLLKQGFVLTHGDQRWDIKPFTIKRLIQFTPQVDPSNADNKILGVTFDPVGLREYLITTIVPETNQPAVNARFAREGNIVTQFAQPQEGRELAVDQSVEGIIQAVQQRQQQAPLHVAITEPAVKGVADMEALGINELLATGESNFTGSPANRIHNIRVGTSRYHGLLIEPGQEFSFNEYLGPVDGVHGFKPELVIKSNVTIPEFGGGLCQVSTTAFRAAIYAGLEITQRRNHAYAVSYYGTPGFDSTIYPPYTDLRFINNTPGYILIQTRIEGTKLYFEFWGTNDGRTVEVKGPHPYDRQPDGAVKATLTQTVTRQGEVVLDDTFYSRYRSPNLFPKVLAADDPNNAPGQTPAPTNAPTNQPAT